MIDDFNQRIIRYAFGNIILGSNGMTLQNVNLPIEDVHGYTVKQLQHALIGARLWNGWRDSINSRYNNPTEVHLDELFNNSQD